MKYSLKTRLIVVFVIGMILLAFLHFFRTSDAEGFTSPIPNMGCLEKCVSENDSAKRVGCFVKCGIKEVEKLAENVVSVKEPQVK